MDLNRIWGEVEQAKAHFDYVEGHRTPESTPFVKAAIQTTCGGLYILDVRFPNDYPYSMPLVFVRKPVITGAKHQYSDGNICYLHPSMWNPGRHHLTFVLSRASKWLNKYEVWKTTNNWPGAEVRH